MATETKAPEKSSYDPITFSVVFNRLQSIANEMTLTLEHTAWTSILALARDFSCAIYDAVPRQIAMYDALPIHTTSQHIVLSEIARTFADEIEEGDIFACNDPYRGNTHVGDLVTACPVFVGGRHLFWTVTKGHQMDTGAFVPSSVTASARNVWQEGLTIPPIKLYERGKPRADVIDLYLSNMRYRDLLRGDLLAQLGSIEKGRERLVELCKEYGADEVMRYVDAIVDYADRRMAEEIRAMPDGTYEGEGWIDTDGVDTSGHPDQGERDHRRRSGQGRLHGKRGSGGRRNERLVRDVPGGCGDPVHVLHRSRDPTHPWLHQPHQRLRAGRDDLQRAIPSLDFSGDDRSVRHDARRHQPRHGARHSREGGRGWTAVREHPAVLRHRQSDWGGVGCDALQQWRWTGCSP